MLHIFQPFISHMRSVGSGRLVGIASVAGYRGLPGGGAYSASKAAAIAYLESLRVEMHGSGVSVITVCPGYIITPMTTGNPFYMPFLMSAEDMADKIIRVVDRRKLYAVIPWQMAIVARALRLLLTLFMTACLPTLLANRADRQITSIKSVRWFSNFSTHLTGVYTAESVD